MSVWLKSNKYYLLALFFLILITFGNSLNNAFLSDDLAEIVNNPNLGNLGHIISSHPFGFIRPLIYWTLFHIAGLNNILFRFSNLLFHIGSTFLIFAILNKLYSKRLALLVSAVFAVHPAIIEAVIWISGGSYPQYSFFFLLSFFLYIISNKKGKAYFGSILALILSFMSHPQMPLALFLVYPFWELCFGDNFKKNWKKTIPFLVVTIIYTLVSLSALPERTSTLQTVNYQERGIDNIFVIIPTALTSYFELIFFPATLTLYHSELSFGIVNFIIRSIITILFFGLSLYFFKKSKKLFFWFIFFLLALAPTLTPFRLNWIVAERYLYLPIIGILVLLGLGIEKLLEAKKFKNVTLTIFVIILIALMTRTILRNIDWKNEDNLWIATGKTSPSSPNTHNNLGDVYGRLGDKQKSLQEFLTAISIKSNYADAYHNAGNVYRETGQIEKALEFYQKASELNPNLWQSYQNIAAIYFESARQATQSAEVSSKQYNLALENMQKAISVSPNNINLYNNLGVIYLAMGNKQKAKEIFNTILSADPQNQFALSAMAEANK
jgi:Flp pilus assembly protein TadD